MEDYSAFGVFDGHGNIVFNILTGMHGHLASGFVINNLQNYLAKQDFQKEFSTYCNIVSSEKEKNAIKEKIIYEKLKESNYRLLKTSFIKCEYELTQANFDVNFSGTTAVLLIILGKHCIIIKAIF
jgi:serine/threonine protein phosphatase PrpC